MQDADHGEYMQEGRSVGNQLRLLLAKAFNRSIEEIKANTTTADLGMDSLSLVLIATNVEAECSIALTEADLWGLIEAKTVGEMTALLESCVNRR
jgi:acyl carrier protein